MLIAEWKGIEILKCCASNRLHERRISTHSRNRSPTTSIRKFLSAGFDGEFRLRLADRFCLSIHFLFRTICIWCQLIEYMGRDFFLLLSNASKLTNWLEFKCCVHGTHHVRVRNCEPTHADWVQRELPIHIMASLWHRFHFLWAHHRRYSNLHTNGLTQSA